MYWQVPPVWKDGQCIIIGGGPSIPKQFDIPDELVSKVYVKKEKASVYSPYMKTIHDQHIIAVNIAYEIGNWMDVVFFGDGGFIRKTNSDILKSNGLKVTCAEGIESYHRKVFILRKSNKKYGIDFNPRILGWNFNSGAAAINLAVHFGVKRIILLGFDMKLDENKNQHWHKYYGGVKRTISATFRRHLKGFPYIAADLKGKVEVINACPDSMIDCFPRMRFKDIDL